MAERKSKEDVAVKLTQMLRNDLLLISNEAKKKHPVVKEAAERGAMRLKSLSEQRGFSIRVLVATNDVVNPLLSACDSNNPRIIQVAIGSLQKLIQYNAIPTARVETVINTLQKLVDNGLEELKVLQTIMLLSSATDTIKGNVLTNVLMICFQLYESRDPSLHNTANVAIRQVVQTKFDRLNVLANSGGLNSPEPPPPDSSPSVSVDHRQLPVQVRDGYLIFQDLCFLINGDPAAWLPPTLNLEIGLGLELLEIVLKDYPIIFAKEKLFSVLLTERVCPLVIKLFSPSSKQRHMLSHSPLSSSMLQEKPSFALHIRLLRILRILIKQYFTLLVTQCEIFLSMLVRFLDNDKPLWQRTLAVEVLHLFANDSSLLRSFIECYDMQQHSTKVFGDIVDGIAAFIQSNFSHSISSSLQTSNTGNPLGGNNGENIQHSFVFRNVSIQCDVLSTNAYQKPLLLEMLEKQDIPVIPEGYPLVVSMTTLFDTIKSISLVVNDQSSPLPTRPETQPHSHTDVSETMLSSCWSAVLSALALLLDLVSDDHTTRLILESFRLFIQLCGTVHLTAPRDACLTALCKASLPPKLAMSLVTQPGSHHVKSKHTDRTSQAARLSAHFDPSKKISEGSVNRKRISLLSDGEGVGVTSSTPSGQLTCKNIECFLTLLTLVHHHGDILDKAWHLVLTTIQHITLVMGLTPSKNSSVKLNKSLDQSNLLALVSNEKRSEISEIASKIEELFSNSKFLSEKGLLSLVHALCQLSDEAMQVGTGKEISIFPIISLQETCNSNLSRVSVVWDAITTHITMLCSHNDPSLRQASAEILTTSICTALTYHLEGTVDCTLQTHLLQPLLTLSQSGHLDVRQKQMECVGQILHSCGQMIQHNSWMIILEVINTGSLLQSDTLIRGGFSSLQLIVTDFLPLLPPLCLPVCLEVISKYGLQEQDLNISLSSIGLMWNIADYLNQHQSTVEPEMESLRNTTLNVTISSSLFLQSLPHSSLPVFDAVWMLLFTCLSDLCVNEHSAIRKSAAQTLFTALSAHGSLLQPSTWQAVLWQVLFTILEKVLEAITSSSSSTLTTSSSSSSSSSILIHHSRDTAQKQWAETQVIVLTGVSRVVHTRLDSLFQLEGFERAWTTLLNIIKNCTINGTNEVAVAAVSSFQLLLQTPDSISIPSTSLWEKAWSVWLHIGREVAHGRPNEEDKFLLSQDFFINLLQLFPLLHKKLNSFTPQQLKLAFQVFNTALLSPVPKDVSPFLVPMVHENTMTSVQRLVLYCLSSVITTDDVFQSKYSGQLTNNSLFDKSEIKDPKKIIKLLPSPLLYYPVFNELLRYFSFLCSPPSESNEQKHVNMAPFAFSSLTLSLQLMRSCVLSHDSQMTSETELMMEEFLKAVHQPLKLKYNLHPLELWVTLVNMLLFHLEWSLPILTPSHDDNDRIWSVLGIALYDLLFAEIPQSVQLSIENQRKIEDYDIKVIQLLKTHISLPSTTIPSSFISKWAVILNKGSLHSLQGTDTPSSVPLREHFSRVCFEALLQLSFMDHEESSSHIALNGILERSECILRKYSEEEKLSGSCPPSRSLLNEVFLVLKSTTLLIQSLKNARKQGSSVNISLWNQGIKLYPVLIECITCSNLQLRVLLKETLEQFSDLIDGSY